MVDFAHSRIVRALLVLEVANSDGTRSALTATQTGGEFHYAIESELDFVRLSPNEYGWRPHGRPPSGTLTLHGYPQLTIYQDADTLFGKWAGPQPHAPEELGATPALPAPRKELEP